MKMTNIYGLYDPRDPKTVMYVGKGLLKRAESHWKHFSRRGKVVNVALRCWFEKLKVAGVIPSTCILEENVPLEKWEEREVHWIAVWRIVNSDLCNLSAGGNQLSIEATRLGGSIGGRIGGHKVHKMYPNLAREGGHKVHKVHPNLARKIGRIGGRIGGRHKSEVKTIACRKNGCLGAYVTNHQRWHIARGFRDQNCKLCFEVL